MPDRPTRTLHALTLMLSGGLLSAGSVVMAEPMEYMDVFEIEYATAPRFSPDGEHIVYQRTGSDRMKDRRGARLWIMERDGDNHRPLTGRDASEGGAVWSPDGNRIAFVSSGRDGAELFIHWVGSGDTAVISQLPASPSALAWSPDGEWLAFSMSVKYQPEQYFSIPGKPEGAEWADPPKVIDRTLYRADGQGMLEPSFTQLFVVPADGGSPRQLTEGNFNHGGSVSWTPDGEALLFAANRNDDWEHDLVESELHRVSLADGSITTLTDRNGPDFGPELSPDGDRLAWLGFDDTGISSPITRLYLRAWPDGEIRELTSDLDHSVLDFRWSADSRSLYIIYDKEGDTEIAQLDHDGDRRVLINEVGGDGFGRPYSGGDFDVADDGLVVYTDGRGARPAELTVQNRRGGKRVLTRLNRDLFSRVDFSGIEEVWYESSHDGRRIHGWIAKPPGFDPEQTYPLILEIHGGPHTNYGARFSEEVQLYAAQGYVVLYTNPRGSTSYGEEFANLIHQNYPSEDYDDLMSGVDYMLEQGYIDPERLYVTGGSGGGVLTAWIIGKTDRFRAAVVAKPVINWTSFVLTSDFYPFFTKYWFENPPWEDVQAYWDRSPLSLVGNVTTPTMILTGEADVRTPISESEQYYQALRLRGVESVMVRIPGAFHGIAARPSQLIAKTGYIVDWFDRHGGEESNEDEAQEGEAAE